MTTKIYKVVMFTHVMFKVICTSYLEYNVSRDKTKPIK